MRLPEMLRAALAVSSAILLSLAPSPALANTAASTSPSPFEERAAADGQSTFISPGGQIGFGLTVPPRSAGSDVFFTLRVPVGISWGAVGLGSTSMNRALVLLIYMNDAGDNVTFSPRYGQGHFEPAWLDEVQVQVLDGTGIVNQAGIFYMLFRARCTAGCRSWHNGYLDVTNNDVEAIYAFGPAGVLASDDVAAPLLYHVEHGNFRIDMGRTTGASDAPVVDASSTSSGSYLEDGTQKSGLVDGKEIAHGVVMIISAVAILLVGALLLTKKGFIAHVATQLVGFVGVMVGFGLGISASFTYQRTRSFRSGHQILGLVLVAAVLAMPVLGFLHHRQYVRTQQKGRLSQAHRWTGLIVIAMSLINAFLGFALAQDFAGGRMFAGIAIVLGLFGIGARFLLEFRRRQWNRRNGGGGGGGAGAPSSQPPSWRQNPPPGAAFDTYTGAEGGGAQPTHIDLMPVSSPPSHMDEPKGGGGGLSIGPRADLTGGRGRNDLGPMQEPREFA